MSLWSFWTSISIIVLTAGSLAVFGWFLRDILRIRRDLQDGAAGPTGDDRRPNR